MKRFIGLAATAALVAFAQPAQAQMPISFGIGAGATAPTGDLKDGVNTGYHVMGTLGIHAPLMPIGFRADVMYGKFGAKTGSADLTDLNASANVVYSMGGVLVKPYLLAGVDYDHATVSGSSTSQNNVGFNGGLGLKFGVGPLNAFGEVRYHYINSKSVNGVKPSVGYIPVTVGITF